MAVEGPDPKSIGAQERTLAFMGLWSQAKRVSWGKTLTHSCVGRRRGKEDKQAEKRPTDLEWPEPPPHCPFFPPPHTGLPRPEWEQGHGDRSITLPRPELSSIASPSISATGQGCPSAWTMPFREEQSHTGHEVGVKGGACVSAQNSMPCHLTESPAPSSFGTWKWLRAVV